MVTKGKISPFQFFVMLFISRTLTTVTYISSYTKGILISDMLIQPFFRISIGIIIMIPIYLLYKKSNDKNVLDLAKEKSTKLSKPLAAIYVLAFFYFTVVTVARLDVFAGTVVFPEIDVDYMIIFVIAFCCYGAYLGFEALGRSAVLTSVLVIPAIVFILLALTDKVDLLNLTPVFYNGVAPVVKNAVDSIGQTIEYAVIAIAIPKVSGKMTKGFFIWLFSQTLLMAVMFFFAGTVMGNFSSTQLFPFHTLASLAEFTILDRLDAVFTSVWIMCAFIKASLLIFLQAEILYKEFGKLKKSNYLAIVGAVSVAVNLFIAGGIERFTVIDNAIIKIIVTTVTAFIIPLIILILTKGGGNKKCKEA